MVYCNDITGLITTMGISYNSSEWRLFIGSSTKSLNAVLLNNGNDLGSIPIGYSMNMTETYDNKIGYSQHKDDNYISRNAG